MKINSRQELYEYLHSFNSMAVKDFKFESVYFLVKNGDHVWPIRFLLWDGACFESPCTLRQFPLSDAELPQYIEWMYGLNCPQELREYEKMMQRDGVHYMIENFQCDPFLPEQIEILDAFSNRKCLDWLLSHSNKLQEEE